MQERAVQAPAAEGGEGDTVPDVGLPRSELDLALLLADTVIALRDPALRGDPVPDPGDKAAPPLSKTRLDLFRIQRA